jgi:hypothetical protein
MYAMKRGRNLSFLSRWITVGTPFITMRRRRFLYQRLPPPAQAAYIFAAIFPALLLISIAVSWNTLPTGGRAAAPFVAPLFFLPLAILHALCGSGKFGNRSI